nr:M48 family metallopeptidase [Solobacterium sp.]
MEIIAAGRRRQVNITRKRMKNIVMRVDADGSLRISCPHRTPLREIEVFIRERETWIARTERNQSMKQEKLLTGADRQACTWLGRRYPVRIEHAGKSWLSFEEGTAVFHLKTDSPKEIERVFYRAAGKQLAALAEELRGEWDEEICRKNRKMLPVIRLKYMTSRWGSCTPAKNSISLSLRLIHFPVQCLEYVLL